ncbi:TatD family hydrolase [Thioalkalicoccus limnaeus]|uniref:TatD family hydrolase n=1 Tax=Thioalkalicoccus limnaeus TaxID=120681 RepID=A0ABV4B9I9_9GAMM
MFADSHCHLDCIDLSPYGGEFSGLVAAAERAGVTRMLCVAIDLRRFPAMRALVDPYPRVLVSVGVHPNAPDDQEPSADELMAMAADPRCVAIGETGLDFFRDKGDPGWQRVRFRRHIEVARAIQKPLIVHTRSARDDTLRLLIEGRADEIGGVMHCFTEDWDMARRALDLGFHISFSGIVTFRNAAELREVARRVPLDRLLIETDAPYLAPVPHRGRPNEPKYLPAVAQCIADLRGLDRDEVARRTSDNYQRLFGDIGAGPL